MYDIVEGVVVFPDAPGDPIEILSIVEELAERIIDLEMECNNVGLVPVVVEQAVGQMAEDYLTFAYNQGMFENAGSMSLEEIICMGEYYHNDSFFHLFEVLNYTPSICGGSYGCPDCPDCGLSENCRS